MKKKFFYSLFLKGFTSNFQGEIKRKLSEAPKAIEKYLINRRIFWQK